MYIIYLYKNIIFHFYADKNKTTELMIVANPSENKNMALNVMILARDGKLLRIKCKTMQSETSFIENKRTI